jgi:hypothetical protein
MQCFDLWIGLPDFDSMFSAPRGQNLAMPFAFVPRAHVSCASVQLAINPGRES